MPPPARPNPEVLTRAILEQPPAPGTPLTPEQQQADTLRAKIEEEGTDKALESLKKPEAIDKPATDKAVDNNIGTERDPTTGAKTRNATEQARFTQTESWKRFHEQILESGYDSLSVTNKAIARAQLETALRVFPPADALLGSMSPAEKQAVLESVLKNPDVLAKMRVVYSEVFSHTLEDEITPAVVEDAQRQAEKDQLDSDRSANAGKLSSVNTQLARFQEDLIAGTVGVDLQTIRDVEAEMPVLKAGLATRRTELAALQLELSAIERQIRTGTGPATPADYTLKMDEITSKATEMQAIQDRMDLPEKLRVRERSLKEEKEKLEKEKVELEGKNNVLIPQLSKARADLTDKKLTRSSQEDQFVANVQAVLSEATVKWLEEKIKAADTVEREHIQKEIETTGDPAEKAILKEIMDRWLEDKTVGILNKSQIKVPDRTQVNLDFSTLMTSGDPKVLMRQMLTGSGLSTAEIDAKLANPDFVNKFQPQVVEKLITYKLRMGKLNEDEAWRIATSPWGENMIENALNNNKNFKSMVSNLESQGYLQGGIKEWIRKASKGSVLRFLLLLLGTAAASFVAVNALPAVLGAGAAGTGLRTGLKNTLFPNY